MPVALSREFIDSKKLSNFLFGHNVLSDGIRVFHGEQARTRIYWLRSYNRFLKSILSGHQNRPTIKPGTLTLTSSGGPCGASSKPLVYVVKQQLPDGHGIPATT